MTTIQTQACVLESRVAHVFSDCAFSSVCECVCMSVCCNVNVLQYLFQSFIYFSLAELCSDSDTFICHHVRWSRQLCRTLELVQWDGPVRSWRHAGGPVRRPITFWKLWQHAITRAPGEGSEELPVDVSFTQNKGAPWARDIHCSETLTQSSVTLLWRYYISFYHISNFTK